MEDIFSFLHRDDLLQAMSVCTSWKSVISSSSHLWRRQTFIFDCTYRAKKKTKVDMFYVTQNFGHHFQTLTVKCRPPYMLHCTCMKMAEQFNLLLAGFKSPDLSSFKVAGLRMECTT
ncbi:F-box only protein 39 [Biomphalaria glabrata]|nr:hypothetical protein BgiMline_021054 [Biomphalaria glabrata]